MLHIAGDRRPKHRLEQVLSRAKAARRLWDSRGAGRISRALAHGKRHKRHRLHGSLSQRHQSHQVRRHNFVFIYYYIINASLLVAGPSSQTLCWSVKICATLGKTTRACYWAWCTEAPRASTIWLPSIISRWDFFSFSFYLIKRYESERSLSNRVLLFVAIHTHTHTGQTVGICALDGAQTAHWQGQFTLDRTVLLSKSSWNGEWRKKNASLVVSKKFFFYFYLLKGHITYSARDDH